MAQSKKNTPPVDEALAGFESQADAASRLDTEPIVDVTGTTAEHPDVSDLKEDDKVSAVIGDAELNDPPVRTNRPDVPIVQSLAVGAGQHKPPTDPELDTQGRLRPDIAVDVALKQQDDADK